MNAIDRYIELKRLEGLQFTPVGGSMSQTLTQGFFYFKRSDGGNITPQEQSILYEGFKQFLQNFSMRDHVQTERQKAAREAVALAREIVEAAGEERR